MPIYEYCCQKCGEFEITQKITEPSMETCPTCGNPVKKLISNTTFKLVGTGWYLTDYAKKGTHSEEGKESNAASNDGKESQTASSKGDGKADTSTSSEKKASADDKPAKGSSSESTASSS